MDSVICQARHFLLSSDSLSAVSPCLFTGKFVPEEAVKEMKANYVLPSEREPFIDEILWAELPKEQCVPLVQS